MKKDELLKLTGKTVAKIYGIAPWEIILNFFQKRVRLRRKVLAPYKDSAGKPKDWVDKGNKKFRDTAPSNLWSDITIPFWSMPENTDHLLKNLRN